MDGRNSTPTSTFKGSSDRGPLWDPPSPPPTPPNDEESALPSKEEAVGQGKDPNIVDWDGPDDKENPRNWTTGYKSWITFQLSMLALAASLGSSIIAPGETAIAEYTGVSTEVTVLVISLYV
jgi:hypothetical protein